MPSEMAPKEILIREERKVMTQREMVRYINKNQDYAHVEGDELIFFNQALSPEEVSQLYNMYP